MSIRSPISGLKAPAIFLGFLSLMASIGSALAQGSLQTPPSTGYRIGPGDVLEVFVWQEDDLSTNVPVRPDGLISTPLVEDMVAAGKTPSQLASDIEQVLAEYIRAPEVTVIVQEFVGTVEAQISVLGEAVNPGNVPYRDGMTLLAVMLEVGGLSDFASGNRSKLIRTVDGEPQETRLRLKDLLEKGRTREDVTLQPGDVIVIPSARF